ncbi:MAG: hypothetical protein AUI33_02235 [Ignavibacteria bacterium 13_1_40CM_2_61_4]|nr:MAG: hypothetical protein AUI33_02235 [Ignavibacteria bacterium 13_1_40CM_2_61_4]
MNNTTAERSAERGAISIKTLLVLVVLAAAAFAVIKIAPVYVEQQRIVHDVDDLANKATVRGMKEDKINQEIKRIRGEYDLPEKGINLVSRDKGVQISVSYQRDIDFLVTSYSWKVDHTAVGKEL